jgi:hypothetical protein
MQTGMLHSVAIFASMMILIRRTLNEKLGFENTKINHHEKGMFFEDVF